MVRQVVTLQLGTHANFIGSHYWNLQDEYLSIAPASRHLQPSVLFRETNPAAARHGSALYTPRLQVIDATSAFGALNTSTGDVLSETAYAKTTNTSVQPDDDSAAWTGSESRYVRDRISPSPYVAQLNAEQEQDDSQQTSPPATRSKYWSDFLKTRFHQRSCVQLTAVHHNVTPFSLFEEGISHAKSTLLEDLYDDLRFFIEECDTFGGISLLVNPDDAYAGMASSYISHIRDELGSTAPLLLFAAQNHRRQYVQIRGSPHPFDKRFENICTRNEAQFAASCHELDVQYIPASSLNIPQIPYTHTDEHSQFHSTALLALAIDVAQTPFRYRTSMSHVLSTLRPAPFASFSSLGCNIPSVSTQLSYANGMFAMQGSTNLSQTYHAHKAADISDRACTEVISARGLSYRLPVMADIPTPITLPIPFPNIFDPALDRYSTPSERAQQAPVDLEQISLLAGVGTVPSVEHSTLHSLGETLKVYARSNDAQILGVDAENLREAAEQLVGCAEDYANL